MWCLFFAFMVPEVGTLFRATRICIFKSIRRCTIGDFILILFFETCHVVGMALFIFVALPQLDVVKGAMITNCVAFLPAVFGKTNLLYVVILKNELCILTINKDWILSTTFR